MDFLAGLRVLDLSQYLPGPYAALMLADLGAEVVKVEPPGGDPGRTLAPLDADGLSPVWKLVNAGKQVAALDLKQPADAEILAQLLARTDVLVESYRPGVLDRLGFTRERLASLNPRLVHAALSGYGQTGPWRLRTGHDLNYMAVGGGLAAAGPRAAPSFAFPPTADYASGVQAALAVCAALVGRARSGRGAFLDLSLTETVLAWQAPLLTWAQRGALRGPSARAALMLNGGAAYYQVYRTRDGRFVTLGAIEAKFWRNFCAAVGRADWRARQDEALPQTGLIAELAALFATRDAAAWEALLGPVDCCFAVVAEPAEVPLHPQVAARGLVARPDDATVAVGFPAHVDGRPPPPRPPVRIADAREVLARWSPKGSPPWSR
jgi:crotonobetainyl-CoA:carnitine CoA-transferase CaiB-like acyl-CoA transferase